MVEPSAPGGSAGTGAVTLPRHGRLLAIDWGARRLGLARSDERQVLATPLETLTRRAGKRLPLGAILGHVERDAIAGIVVGLPLDAAGDEGDAARAARQLADDLARLAPCPVTLWDERFSTARALGALRETGTSTRGARGDLDALAASVLLQHFLDARRAGGVA